MALVVHKYGGTSVGTIERIKHVASHLATVVTQGDRVVCVVSAMGQQTNELLGMALQISHDPPKRELDMLLTVGERISMSLLSIALHEVGIESVSLTGSQSGILTDSNHTNARISKITGERIKDALTKNRVVIVAGFQGVNPINKEITTLGRGGSDLTAAALAHHVTADECEIYTDVLGICTADPRIVPRAAIVRNITWHAASELAWNGAKVIQSRAVHLAGKYGIPLRKRSSFDLSDPGTLISGKATMESVVVNAITNKDHQCVVTCKNLKDRADAHRVIAWLWQQGCAPLMQNQILKEDGTIDLKILIPESLNELMNTKLKELHSITDLRGLASVSVIGEGFLQSPEIVAKIIDSCVGPVLHTDTRNNCVTVCVRSSDQDNTIRSLHHLLFEAQT